MGLLLLLHRRYGSAIKLSISTTRKCTGATGQGRPVFCARRLGYQQIDDVLETVDDGTYRLLQP